MAELSDDKLRRGVLRVYRDNDDMTNERIHPCGCVTFFDTLVWQSVIVLACDEHKEYARG